ncbi:hypothetical protein GCM10022202_26460 [Microbacterium marinilacus]|uniref:AbiTii domain-containing protein n=2 Tax=Microbacterium marinilacus TaxID=415209 RepID=A0ABP7BLE8_9MICO
MYPENDAEIGQRLSEWLLLHTLEDLRVRSAADTDVYTRLGISALLRKLLVEKHALVDSARARLRIPAPTFEYTPFDEPEFRPFEPAPDGSFKLILALARDDFTEPTVRSQKDGFLAATCGYHYGEPVTVRDTIRYFANTHGGVHAGEPRSDFERTVQRMSVSLDIAAEGWMKILPRLATITMRALEPVADRLRASPSRPSFPTIRPE